MSAPTGTSGKTRWMREWPGHPKVPSDDGEVPGGECGTACHEANPKSACLCSCAGENHGCAYELDPPFTVACNLISAAATKVLAVIDVEGLTAAEAKTWRKDWPMVWRPPSQTSGNSSAV